MNSVPYLPVTIATLILPAIGLAQSRDSLRHEHPPFACLEDGLSDGQAFGCQLLARPRFAPTRNTPVFWHLTKFGQRREAEAVRRSSDAVVEVDGGFWVTGLGARSDTLTRGVRVAAVGPLPMPKTVTYQMDLFYVIMQPRARTVVHTHPGPEAWYVLEGEQCLETPLGAIRAKAGEGALAPPGGTPMQLSNTGAGTRRALFIVVRDPSLPRSTASDWRPAGLCDRSARSER